MFAAQTGEIRSKCPESGPFLLRCDSAMRAPQKKSHFSEKGR
jgi:hypothetical protein